MRTGHKGHFISDNGMIGVNLGYDSCAEHEWGIKDLRRILGCKDDVFGIEKRRIGTIKPENICVRYHNGLVKALIVSWTLSYGPNYADGYLDRPLRLSSTAKTPTFAWDGDSFGIHVQNEKDMKDLTRIYDRMMAGDVAVWLGGGGFFQNAGLVLCVISTLPRVRLEEMYAADEDNFKLKQTSESMHIHEKIRAADFEYFALSPRWSKGCKKSTNYPVVYWLNPQRQNIYHAGLFSIEELEQWFDGKGPVIKSKQDQRRW